MQPSADVTDPADAVTDDASVVGVAGAAAVAAEDPRATRARLARAGTWLAEVWAGADDRPDLTWAHLVALPDWAVEAPSALDRLTLVAGALFAAPSLRVCLDPAPLLRVRALIGAPALEQVLAVPGLPPVALPWPADEGDERHTLRGWGAGLLLASLDDDVLRASVARALDAAPSPGRLLPPVAAGRLVALARHVLQAATAPAVRPEESVA